MELQKQQQTNVPAQAQNVQETTLKGMLMADATKRRLNELLGSKAAGFTSSILSLYNSNAMLKTAEPMSIMNAAVIAASLDLPINPNLGFAAIVPYRNKGVVQAQFQLMYKGLIELCMRSGQFLSIIDETVYEGQLITKNRFTGEYTFDEDAKTSDKVIGYMAYFKLLNGFAKTLYMSKEQVESHALEYSQSYRMDKAKGWTSSVWSTNFDVMARKGLCVNTLIPTPSGFKKMGDISVGDKVFDINGNETAVIAVSERKNIPCYKVTFSNGESVVCDHEHDWVVRINGRKKMIKGVNYYDEQKRNIEDLYRLKIDKPKTSITIRPAAVEYEERNLLVDPYVFGYWLGNGSKRGATISCHIDDSEFVSGKIHDAGFCTKARKDKRSNAVCINVSRKDKSVRTGGLKCALRDLGVLNNKHIPTEYKLCSIRQRVEFLRGFFDADGCVSLNKRARVTIGQTEEHLINDLYEILCSIGEVPNIISRVCSGFDKKVMVYEIQLKPTTNLFSLPRKANRFRDREIAKYWSIKSIEKIDSTETVCIGVDSPTKTFLCTKSYIPTHNTLLKLLLSKYAPKSIEIQRAVIADQAVAMGDLTKQGANIEDANFTYVDNDTDKAQEVAETIETQANKGEELSLNESEVVDTETGEVIEEKTATKAAPKAAKKADFPEAEF